jgi:branched-subunit amino acid ABC-type transport system permease component
MTQFLQAIVAGLSDATLFVMLSVGLTMMFGVLGVVNFAQGDFMTLAAYIGLAGISIGLSAVASLVLMVPAIMLLGALFYFVVLRPTERHSDEARLLGTFGCAFVLQGAVGMIWGVNPRAAVQSTGAHHVGGVTIPDDLLINGTVAIIAVLALFVFLNRSTLGREIRATAIDSVGAELCGVDTARAKLAAAMVASGLTAVGGLMLLTSTQLYPEVGFALVLNAFAVVILGGLGSIGGTVAASLIIGMAMSFVSTYIDASYANLVAFGAIILVLLVRPTGLAGTVVGSAR